ncbi:MAG: hypothetical protein Q9219_003757 [cf. Caloplaca sp. 3 TL-2023]
MADTNGFIDQRLPQGATCPISSNDWEDYHEIIERLYVKENKTLPLVVQELKRDYGFAASERQYKRRISEWHLDKNVKEDEMRAIIAMEAMRLRQGKESTFYVRGHPVDPTKIKRFARRKRIDQNSSANGVCNGVPPDVSPQNPTSAAER